MITFHVESFRQSLPEFEPLLPLHWAELALNQDKVPLKPQWNLYFQREDAGELLFVAAREEGKIVGYFIGFVSPGLHYETCLTCIMDIMFIQKDKRIGTAGIRLFKFVETELVRRGVQRWFVGSKVYADASALFERLKFTKTEVFYSKWIGE